jgi:hypothetical protein
LLGRSSLAPLPPLLNSSSDESSQVSGTALIAQHYPCTDTRCASPPTEAYSSTCKEQWTIISLCIAYWLDFQSLLCKSTHPRAPPLSLPAFLAVRLVLQMLPLPGIPRYLIEKCQNNAGASSPASNPPPQHPPTRQSTSNFDKSRLPLKSKVPAAHSDTVSWSKRERPRISEEWCFAVL